MKQPGATTVRNLLDAQRSGTKTVNSPVGTQMVTGPRPGAANAKAAGMKGVIDLTDDDDHSSPPKGRGAVRTVVRTIAPGGQVLGTVRPTTPGVATTAMRPGTMFVQQPGAGGAPMMLQQVVSSQSIRSQGATYVYTTQTGAMMAPGATLVRGVLPGQTQIRPGQQIIVQRPITSVNATVPRLPPPLQSAPANQVRERVRIICLFTSSYITHKSHKISRTKRSRHNLVFMKPELEMPKNNLVFAEFKRP